MFIVARLSTQSSKLKPLESLSIVKQEVQKELICLLSLPYLKMSLALKPAFAPT
jgi:hypothetical protein